MGKLPTEPFEEFPTSTYFWGHPSVISTEQFKLYSGICDIIIKASGTDIGDGLGRVGSKRTVDNALVSFNGKFPECSETFYFPRVSEDIEFLTPDHMGNFFRFCETGGKNYDLLVGACLEAAVYCGLILEYGREEGPVPTNLLWESVKQHLDKGENDAN